MSSIVRFIRKDYINIKDYGAVGDNSTDDGNAINAAIAAAGANGTVFFPHGTYYSTKRHTPLQGQTWFGNGIGVSTIRGLRAFDYSIYFVGSSSVPLQNFYMRDMSLDVDNSNHGSGMNLLYASNNILERVEFKNGATGGWLFKLGVSNGLTETYLNQNNKLIDCVFDTHAGSLEMLLLFNSKNTEIIRPRFLNKSSGPGLGLWQKTYNTKIVEPYFLNCGICVYYSVTCEDTIIENIYGENCTAGIQGANVSDNGQFGETQAKRLKIINPTFIGGAASTQSTAIQLGAVDDVQIINPTVEEFQIAVNFTDGNNSAHALATNWTIENPTFKNNNASGDFYTLHPAIFFTSIGGSMTGKMIGGNIYDDQVTKTQRYPITFSGAFTWSDIEFLSTRLSPDTANSGTPYTTINGAAIDSTVLFKNCKGLNPDILYAQGDVTGGTTFNRLNGNIITATLTGNITVILTSSKCIGDELKLILSQDGTGSRTISWPSNFKKSGSTLTLSTLAESVDVVNMMWDGTYWQEISRAMGVS